MKPTFSQIEKRVTSLETMRAASTPSAAPPTLAQVSGALEALRARLQLGAPLTANEQQRLARINELFDVARARRREAEKAC